MRTECCLSTQRVDFGIICRLIGVVFDMSVPHLFPVCGPPSTLPLPTPRCLLFLFVFVVRSVASASRRRGLSIRQL